MACNKRRHGKSRVPTEALKRNKELRFIRHEKMQRRMFERNTLAPPCRSALEAKSVLIDTWSQYRRDVKRAARKYNISREA